jgi:hypothetical protein
MRTTRTRMRILAFVIMIMAMAMLPLGVYAAPPAPTEDTAPAEGTAPAPQAMPVFGAPTTVRAWYGLRLREGPGLSEPIILVLRNGETVYPAGEPIWAQGIAWQFVRVYRWGLFYDGFAASSYLANYGGYNPPAATSGLKVIAPAGLRLRAGPGLGYATYRIVPYGTVLQPAGQTAWGNGLQWTKVSINGTTLWAATMYLQAV